MPDPEISQHPAADFYRYDQRSPPPGGWAGYNERSVEQLRKDANTAHDNLRLQVSINDITAQKLAYVEKGLTVTWRYLVGTWAVMALLVATYFLFGR